MDGYLRPGLCGDFHFNECAHKHTCAHRSGLAQEYRPSNDGGDKGDGGELVTREIETVSPFSYLIRGCHDSSDH